MKKVAIVTGGTSGIGLSCVNMLLNRGYTVYAVARKHRDIPGARVVTGDVCSDVSMKKIIDEVAKHEGRLDILVNNAGFGTSGAVEFTEISQAKMQFEVNFFGMLNCIKPAVPHLRNTKGKIINISSMTAVFAIPFQAMYSASKCATNGLTLALRNELKPFGIGVCAVQPGDIKTEFSQVRQKEFIGTDIYGDVIKRSLEIMEKDEENGAHPDVIGKRVAKIADKKNVRPLYTVGFIYKLYAFANKIFPTGLVYKILRKMYT